ncbi:autotransporter domain-containing protein [Rhizobium sp. P40RR-XXII]|uniref:autotransporter domain-containing protein n=1 Tax=Rhizobium sp. P40RR-XXII TaxID=2726739 RepID=UPI0014573E28|nr:autotransporter domain-containing protein [Rhizobium sp. P40RR-XXII]NLS20067.1 autotransporter domain-containing protein [Rhizobium sp. P40RR-XXII]
MTDRINGFQCVSRLNIRPSLVGLLAGVSLLALLVYHRTAHAQDQVVDGQTVIVSNAPSSDFPSPLVISGALIVGDAGNGVLTVVGSGSVSSASGIIGNAGSSSGTVTVDGAGSNWGVAGSLVVGDAGSGTLAVANGGVVSTASFDIARQAGSAGTLNIGSAAGGTPTAAGTVDASTIAFGSGTGTIVFNHTGNPDGSDYSFAPVITGTGTIDHLAGNTILTGSNSAGSDFTGTLNLSGGNLTINGTFGDTTNNHSATVNVTGAANLTGSGTIAGNLNLDRGATLSWQSGQTMSVLGILGIGDTADANLSIGGASKLTSNVLEVGAGAGGSGSLIVDGVNANATVSQLLVGYNGDGALTVSGGGQFSSFSTAMGWASGSSGTVTVTGLGSTFDVNQGFYIGNRGRANVTVNDGGTLHNGGNVEISGEGATVTGAGSRWVSDGDVSLTGDGTTLAVLDGGTFNSGGYSNIGVTNHAANTLKVSGSGSKFTSVNDASIGLSGAGILTVSDGGVFSVTSGKLFIATIDYLNLPTTGMLNIGSAMGDTPTAAGTIDASTIAFGSGTGTIVFNHTGNPDGSDYSFAPVITGTGTIDHLAGNTILTGSNSAGSDFTGTLNLSGGNLTINGTFGDTTNNHSATVNVTGAANLTGSGTIAGNLNLDRGAALSWQSGQTMSVLGIFKVGDTGEASLSIGGTSNINSFNLVAGASAGGSGSLLLNGTDARLTTTQVLLGYGGDGELTVSGGGQVNSVLAAFGWDPGSSGILTVTGPGSTFDVTAAFSIAIAGRANITVADGGTVHNGAGVEIGSGGATVTGAGSRWISDGDVSLVGDTTLAVLDGGTFTGGGYSNIGYTNAASTLKVSGSGSKFTSLNDASIGVAGIGALTVADGGVFAVTSGKMFIATNTYMDRPTTGMLNIGSATGDTPTVAGTIDASTIAFGPGTGTIVFNHTGNPDGSDYSFAPVITGTGTIDHLAGNTILTGSNSAGSDFTGTLNLSGGSLTVDGTLGDTTSKNAIVNVTGAANLTGSGTIAGSVSVGNGGTLSGRAGTTLAIGGNLSLASGSITNAALGARSAPALFEVGGNLTLGGTLNVSDAGNFGRGVYRLFDYGGTLTNNGLTIGSTPDGIGASDLSVQTAVAGNVNLVSTAGAALSFWDGGNASLHDNGVVDGGTGTWTAHAVPIGGNWTDQSGVLNTSYDPNPSFAVFQGAAGAVTIDDASVDVGITGMQFAADAYQIRGDPLVLQGTSETTIRVGDGTAAGASFDATIASVLTGSSGLDKTDLGTLILTGENTYTGATTISAGSLQIGAGGTSGSIVGDVVTNGTLAFNRSDSIAFSGKIDGTGKVVQRGTGTLELTNSQNRYTGGTVIESGTLAGSTVSIRGDILNNGLLRITDLGNNTYSGALSGTGSVLVDGIGTLTLAGNNSFTGGLAVLNGKNINASSDANLGGTGNVVTLNGASLTATASFATQKTMTLGAGGGYFGANSGTTLSLNGAINGVGNLVKAGDGILSIGGTASYTGATNINNGTLVVAAGASLTSSSSLTVGSGGTLSGSGTVGTTVVNAGGRISPGGSVGNLSIAGDLTLATGAIFDYELGRPGSQSNPAAGTSDRLNVSGNLTLAGTLNLQQSAGVTDGTAGFGYYRLMTYGGNLSGPGLTIGNALLPADPSAYQIQAGSGYVDLFVAAVGDDNLQTWNGGTGSWTTSGTLWFNQNGSLPAVWAGNTAVFKDDPSGLFAGATIDVVGTQSFKGLQFVDEGYRLQGGGSLLIDGSQRADKNAEIRVLADRAEIATTITGTGGITKTEAGTLVLSGTNSYSGGTTILGGAIEVASNANLGDSSGSLSLNGGMLTATASFASLRSVTLGPSGGAFNVASSNELTLGGVMSGEGDLAKQGSGTLILSGTGSYGDTRVSGGTLIGSSHSISGTIFNGATTVFNQASDGSFDGNITGLAGVSGQMIKRGVGSLSLTGSSTLNWTVEQGDLTAAASRFNGNVAIDSGASFAFAEDTNATYDGVLSGSGSFVKDGNGTLVMGGDSSGYVGETSILNGKLTVGGPGSNARLGGSFVVGNGAVLGGSGTIGNGAGSTVTLNPGSAISPGNSPGTLTVDGNLFFGSGARYDVEVVPGTTISDLIAVTGSAALNGGSVVHVGVTGAYAPTATYTILHANAGLTGAFDSVSSSFAFLDPTLGYGANEVTLTLARNSLAFTDVANTRNQRVTANALESLGFGDALYDAVVQLDSASARSAFDQLSGEIHASAKTAMIEDAWQVRNAINERIRAAFGDVGTSASTVVSYGADGPVSARAQDDNGVSLWTNGFGAWSRVDGDGNAAAIDHSMTGFVLGLDGMVTDDWRLGILGGYSHSSFDSTERASSGGSDNYHIGLYSGAEWGSLAFRSGLAYSWHDIDIHRSATFTGFRDRLSADHNAFSFQAFGELGYRIDLAPFALEPFINLAHVNLQTNGFAEQGGAGAQRVEGDSTDTSFTTLGMRASSEIDLGPVQATVRGLIGWRHAFGDTTPSSTNSFASGNAFAVAGIPITKDAAALELGFDLPIKDAASFGLSYQGQLSSESQSHGINAKFNMRF